jgi:hypothetical protein
LCQNFTIFVVSAETKGYYKMQKYLLLQRSTLILLVLSTLTAQTKLEFNWVRNDAPPFYILEGKNKEQGFGDIMQSLIIDNMQQHTHTYSIKPITRLNLDFETRRTSVFQQ